MATWTRQPQEQDDQKYFFNGGFIVTAGVNETLTQKEINFIYNDVRQFAKEKNGIDYLQSYVNEKGESVWIIDALDQNMIASGQYEKNDNHCTLLFPHEY